MSMDFTKPATTDNYASAFVPAILAAHGALAMMLDPNYCGALANTPVGAKRLYNGAFYQFDGTTWQPYNVNIGGNSWTTSQRAFDNLQSTTQLNAQGSQNVGGMATNTSNLGGICVQNNGGATPAFISLVRNGSYGVYFGLDVDNKLKFGGWSAGANAYEVFHAANYINYVPTLTGGGATGTWAISITGAAATAADATRAGSVRNGGSGPPMIFTFTGNGGQPAWVWGGNTTTDMQVWNPSNFSVSYATNAGVAANVSGSSAASVGSLTAGGLIKGNGGGSGLGKIIMTNTTGSPSGTSAGDLTFVW